MFVWQAHEGAVTSLAFAPGGGLLSTGVDGVLNLWDPATGERVQSWKFAPAADSLGRSGLIGVLADAAGHIAAVGLRGEGVRCIDLQSYRVVGGLELTHVTGFAPAPGGTGFFAVGREGGTRATRQTARLFQYDYAEEKVVAQSRRPAGGGALAVRPDGTEIIVGSTRFRWPVGDRIGRDLIGSSPQYAVSGDGDKLFGMHGTRLMVWGFQVGTVRQRLKGHIAPITGLATTPDGRTLWTAAADASVRQWDVETYRCEKWYGLKVGPLGCVAVSPDALTAAAGSALRGSIALWDLG
jgi:WD40 repeat protein